MIKNITTSILLCLLTIHAIKAQSIDELKQKINQAIKDKSATVAVSIKGTNPADTLSINGNHHSPTQSVYKYHLALAVLHQVDQGKLSLDQLIPIKKEIIEAYQHLWSPLRKKYPDGGEVTLAEMLQYTVAWSDNVGCDLLFKLVGGTHVVQSYLNSIGIKDISVVYTEITMQAKWERQYENWTTSNAANKLLELFYENENNLLSQECYDFLVDVMKGTKTGQKSIRGLLPKETVIAHKTGHSGKNEEGLTAARNDIGIVFLPDGSYFYISILVSDSMETKEATEAILAEVAKLAWDHFNRG